MEIKKEELTGYRTYTLYQIKEQLEYKIDEELDSERIQEIKKSIEIIMEEIKNRLDSFSY